ncbi:MAG: hypothetical protein ACOYOT_07415 [Bacteroidales bacterium]
MKKFLTICLLLSALSLKAQEDFKKGYIVQMNNDTVYGTIDYQGDSYNSKVCRFKTNNHNKITEYLPTELQAYRFIDSGKLFVSKDVKTQDGVKYYFLEYLIKGKLNVYYFRNEMGDHYLVKKDTLRLIELPPFEKRVELDGQEYVRQDHSSKSIMEVLTNDCPEMASKVEKIYLDQKPLISFASEYHKRLCGDNGCIIYAKKPFPVTFFVEPFISNVIYNNKVSTLTSSNPQYGVIIHNWMPRTSEKLFFKTGLMANNVTIQNGSKKESGTIYRVPLMFEYQYPKGKLRPTFGAGWNLVFTSEDNGDMYISTPIDFGLNYSINDRLQISATFNTELSNTTDLINPEAKFQLISNCLSLGLRIKL